MNFTRQPPRRTRFLMSKPIKRPMWEPSGGTVTVPSVVHARGFGTAVVAQGAQYVTVPSVVHTRAFGTPKLTYVITAVSVVHARAFGVPKLSLKIYPGGATHGPLSPGAIRGDTFGPSYADWQNVALANIATQDGVFTYVDLTEAVPNSEWLFLTNLGLALAKAPQGFEVEVIFKTDLPMLASDFKVYMTKNGAGSVGSSQSVIGYNVGPNHFKFGGPTNLWSTTVTEAEAEASTFGFMLEANNGEGGARRVSVDWVRITAYERGAVVHQRVIGGKLSLARGMVSIGPPSVIHTRAFGAANIQADTTIYPTSVIHQRGFGVPRVGGPWFNPDMKQQSIKTEWYISTFDEKVTVPEEVAIP